MSGSQYGGRRYRNVVAREILKRRIENSNVSMFVWSNLNDNYIKFILLVGYFVIVILSLSLSIYIFLSPSSRPPLKDFHNDQSRDCHKYLTLDCIFNRINVESFCDHARKGFSGPSNRISLGHSPFIIHTFLYYSSDGDKILVNYLVSHRGYSSVFNSLGNGNEKNMYKATIFIIIAWLTLLPSDIKC